MSLPLGEVGSVTAELMEMMESEYADAGDVTISAVAVVVALEYTDADGDEINDVRYRCSDGRRWIQSGLFHRAQLIADREMAEDD